MKIKNLFITIIFLILILAPVRTVFATTTGTNEGLQYIYFQDSKKNNYYSAYPSIENIPKIDIDDIANKFNKKQFEIIHFLQVIIQPFSIIAFIIYAIIALIGSIGNGDLTGKGLFGMAFSIIIYAVVLYVSTIFQIAIGYISS